MQSEKKILAVLSDLMFTVKIQEAAKRLGLKLICVASQDEAFAQAKQDPALVIVDLNCAAIEPLDLIAKLKRDQATRNVPLLGYVSHVQIDLKRAAENSGCDVVMPRSAFSSGLPAILERYAHEQSER